ncbi:hypothetical protein [Nocardioides dilutus]
MSTSEPAEALQKAARLRREVEQMEPRTPKRRSFAGRFFSFVRTSLTCLVLIVLAVDVWLAYDAFRREAPESGTSASSPADGPTYSDLEIFDSGGRFAGQVAITNPFDRDIEVFVTVDLYDGEQNVGEVSGNVTLRPDSTSTVELRGFDDLVSYTETRVHLSGWPL